MVFDVSSGNFAMRRHGDTQEIDAAVDATIDAVKADEDGLRDVEMAPSPMKPKSTGDGDSGVIDASAPPGFHPSLGTRNTAQRAKPAPFLRDESFKRISHSPVPFGSLSEAFAFTVFLIVFILATSVVGRDEHGFYFSNRIRAALIERDFEVAIQQDSSSVQKQFVGILDLADLWSFIEGPFLDSVYGTGPVSMTDPNAAASAGTTMLSYNRVLGGVRFRTLRVKPDTCPALARIPEYASLVPYCYGRFSSSIEQTQGYGPILNSADITASFAFKFAQTFFADKQNTKTYDDLTTCYSDCGRSCGDHYGVDRFRYTAECTTACGVHCKCIYEQPVGFTNLCLDPSPNGANRDLPAAVYSYNWSSAASTGASKVAAYTNEYPGSGYVVDLPLNATLAAESVAQMMKNRFVDLATRALVIDFTLFNAYLKLFNIVQFVIEFPSSGGIYTSFSDDVVDVFQYSTPYDTARIVLELLLVAFIAWRWKQLMQKWYSMGIRTYFAYDTLWHAIESAHLTMFLVVIAFRLYVIDLSYGTLSGKIAKTLSSSTPSEIPTFHSLARVRHVDAILSSINASLVWMQFLKYTQMSKRMCLLLRTLRRASADLFWFLVYFFSCICAFAQIGFLLFGLNLARFRSLGVSIVTVLQAVAGDLDYATLAEVHRTLGPIYYVTFYLLLLLILLNVFLAIVNDAYIQTISEQEEEDDAEEATLLRSERSGADQNADVEAHLKRLERHELEQLRKYPFSKGLTPAFKLLVADLKRRVYELRTGNRIFKIDPMVSGMIGVMGGGGGGVGDENAISPPGMRVAGVASRKLTIQVKRQLEKQMQLQELRREAKRMEQEKEQREIIETQKNELAARLTTLVESNREKARRMEDMENMLSSIQTMCQQLVTAAMEDMPKSPKRTTTTATSASGRPLTGSNALAMALQRQKTTGRGLGKNGEAEIEEITL